MKLKVRRYQGDGSEPHYQEYPLRVTNGMTVLDALFQVRDEQDDSLSFRYSCRGAVCGNCAMLINHRPRLACRTQVKLLAEDDQLPHLAPIPNLSQMGFVPGEEILIEPLPNLVVLKDLVVDMEPFFEKYRRLRPYLMRRSSEPERENPMDKEIVAELEKYTNCILCAACYGACPVNATSAEYLGPASLAKSYRFSIDPRDDLGEKRLALAPGPSGWDGCRFFSNCQKVCPKGVPPNHAISKARKIIRKREDVI
jgi:succinate dehydrogenase/fumarate reductase iron-sulfur protein